MDTALLEQFNSIHHYGMLHNVGNTRHQLQISNDKYPHS